MRFTGLNGTGKSNILDSGGRSFRRGGWRQRLAQVLAECAAHGDVQGDSAGDSAGEQAREEIEIWFCDWIEFMMV